MENPYAHTYAYTNMHTHAHTHVHDNGGGFSIYQLRKYIIIKIHHELDHVLKQYVFYSSLWQW